MKKILFIFIFLIFTWSCKQEKVTTVNKTEIRKIKQGEEQNKEPTNLESVKSTRNSDYKFSRSEIINTIHFYTENYGKETTSFDFFDNELTPKLYVLAKMICDNKDEELLTEFLEMILASKGSASETPSDIFAVIYLCKPKLIIDYLSTQYSDEYLASQLEFGFENATYKTKNDIKNYDKLKSDIEKLFKK